MTKRTPSISILMPIYNVADFLPVSLSSVIAAAPDDAEIICLNDGSTDGSLAILESFAARDPRIRIIDKENTGYGDTMNLGLKTAKGKYIGILEPDDSIDPDGFKVLIEAAEKYHADVVKANYYKVREQNPSPDSPSQANNVIIPQRRQFVNTITSENLPELCNLPFTAREHPDVFFFAPAIWSAIYRRSFLEEHEITFLPTPGASYQDLGFSFKVWAMAGNIILLPGAYVRYRTDNANSSVNNPGKVGCVIDEYNEIETYLCERGLFEEFGSIMEAAKFRNYHWNFQRLEQSLARAFYDTWLEDLREANSDHLLLRRDFSFKDWLACRTMLRFPGLAFRTLRLRAKIRRAR